MIIFLAYTAWGLTWTPAHSEVAYRWCFALHRGEKVPQPVIEPWENGEFNQQSMVDFYWDLSNTDTDLAWIDSGI